MILDLISMGHQQDTCLVLPTLDHAVQLWAIVATAYRERHGSEQLVVTHSAIMCRKAAKTLRLWVPYEPEPTMPMDFFRYRRDFELVSPFYTRKELKRWQ